MRHPLIPEHRWSTPIAGQKSILHGGDYNPDQWIGQYPDIVEQDAKLMRLAGINSASVGIFSWTALEPQPDRFTFDWLDRVMDAQAKIGNAVVLATPTGAMPGWLAEKFPDARRVDRQGQRAPWRDRHNHCWTSPSFHERSAIIISEIARRYRGHPALKMWHVSNELSGECYCPTCRGKWADWLKSRYSSLDHLNHAYWAGFWSKLATDWKHVEPADWVMDGMMLDWMRFNNDQLIDWYRFEASVLRPITPELPITTNFMGTAWGLDYQRIAREVDVVCDDQYPTFDADSEYFARSVSFNVMKNSLYRCFKTRGELAGHGRRTFFLMESCPGAVQWKTPQKLKRPGVHRLEMLLAVGAGSDGTCYFQFRAGRGGMEKLHGAVIEHAVGLSPDLAPKMRTFRGVADLSECYRHLDGVVGTGVRAEVALVYDWESKWAQKFSNGTGVPEGRYDEIVAEHFEPFLARGIPVDVVPPDHDLDSYKLVVLPQLWIMTPLLALKLRRFVESGGTLVGTYDTAMSDESDRMHIPERGAATGAIPGCGLTEVFGLWVEETDRLGPTVKRAVRTVDGGPAPLRGAEVAALVHLTTARPLAEFAEDFYAGRPAMTHNRFGQGHAYYVATRLDAASQNAFCQILAADCGLRTATGAPIPEGVVVQMRGAGSQTYLFVTNLTREPRELPTGLLKLTDAETGVPVPNPAALAPLASRVFKVI